MEFLPKPEVTRHVPDSCAGTNLELMELRWHPDAAGTAERAWHLPQGVCVHGPAPERFGIAVERSGANAYKLHLVWNQLELTWNTLSRAQIMSNSLSLILRAIGIDLWQLLQSPAPDPKNRISLAA